MKLQAIQPVPADDAALPSYVFEYMVTGGGMTAEQARAYVDALPEPSMRPFAVWCYDMRNVLTQANRALIDAQRARDNWRKNARWSRISPALFLAATVLYLFRVPLGDGFAWLACTLVVIAAVGLTKVARSLKAPTE